MAVDGWQGRSGKGVHEIVAAMQEQSSGWVPGRFTGLLGRGTVEWQPAPAQSGGVFAAVNESPAWSARYSFTPGNGRGGAYADVFVYDRGDHREVTVSPAYSMGMGARAKEIVKGMAAAAT